MSRCFLYRMTAVAIAAVFCALLFTPSEAPAAERLAISAAMANIRIGAGTDKQTLWQVEKYFPIQVIQKSGEWIYFEDFEGDKGWVHNSLVGKISSVITNKPVCNVREKPDAKSRVLFTTEKGIPFKVLDRKNPWIKVEHADGDVGWIHESLVW